MLARLLDVLNLLPHLFDQYLHVDGDPRGIEFLRLRRERVGLAVQLLHEEIEASTGRFATGHDAANFDKMTIEPIEFLIDIGALQDQGNLLFEPLAIDLHGKFGKALAQLVAPTLAPLR